ncbi:unnamed protein product [Bathycoccus prasinos]
MPRTKAPAKREVETVVDEGEEKQKETPLSTPTKKKKLVKKSKSKAEENEKKRKIEEEEEKEEEDAAKVALKEDDEEGGDDDVAETTASKTKHSTKRARANKEKAGKNAMEMTKKIKEKQEKERKIKTKEEEEKEEDGKADADAGEADAGEEEKGRTRNTTGEEKVEAAAERSEEGSAKLEPAVVEEAPVVKVPSSVPQLKELKQIMEREMIEHEEASASMRAAEMERIAALKALDEANKKAEFSGSHLNRVARRMKQTARKVAAQTVNAQMLEQTMITKTVKNWAKSKDEGMKEASDICMSIMNEWIDLVRNTAHLMQQQQQHKHEGPATESPMDVDTEKKGEETKAGEEEENPLDVKKESKASEENEKNAAKREDEEKKKVEKEEQKPRGGMPPPKILPGGIKVEPNLPGPLADIYKKAAPGASKILEEAKRKTAAMHSIVPKEPDHSSVRMKVLSYLQSTFKLSKDAALTCEAALFNAKAVVGLDYKATLKKLSEDGMSVLKSGSANLDVGRVPPGLTLFMQQTKSLQTKKKRKRKSLK